ncbi:MAG: glycosyltransferase [Rhodothermales bacterium]|nr:glycosyltransferase [Rhodothermales bacterium]
MTPEQIAAQLTVVMHTYDRPEFVEEDVRQGRWKDIPLLISDDASSPAVQVRLESLAREHGIGFTAKAENGGPAQAARHGVEHAGTEFFALCGDDDYLRDFPAFAAEALTLANDPDTLFAVMPEVRFVIPGKPNKVQFDRRVFDGMTGRALLRELVFGGEMRALQAGCVMRRADALPHFASSLFRTSEDFLLVCRLCAARPDAVIRVPAVGSYMRREHPKSLSHRTNMSTERVVVNLLALLAGGRLLQALEDLGDETLLGIVRQRAQVVKSVYGAGLGTLAVLESVLAGAEPPQSTREEREALSHLLTHQAGLPRELALLKGRLADFKPASPKQSPEQLLRSVGAFLDAGDTEGAKSMLADLRPKDFPRPSELHVMRARLAWLDREPNEAVNQLSTALVHEAEHPEALHMLAQIAEAAGETESAARLTNRLAAAQPEAGLEVIPDVEDLRVAFVVSAGLDQFLNDIIRELVPFMDARKFVVSSQNDITSAMAWSDVCWFEWCNDPVVWASRQDIARQKGVICRLHRYEAFSDMPLKVHWENVDALTVVAEHLTPILCESLPGLEQRTHIRHIPNGVDMSRYELIDRSPGFDIALIGYLHGRKNPQMALQILRELVDIDDRYRLHVAGKFQDPVLQLYWNYQIRLLGLADHVVMYAWQDDIAAFLEDKNYILSTSLHESFGYSIAEAMARGIKPLVHHFPFATDMWPKDILFSTTKEAVEIIRSERYDSEAYRAFIQDNYSLESQVEQISELIRSVAMHNVAMDPIPIEDVLSVEPQLVNARLRVRCPSCRANTRFQVQTIGGHPIGQERCESCGAVLYITPERYSRVLGAHGGATVGQDAREATRSVRQIAATWADVPAWADAMTVDGINLAAGMDFDLTPHLIKAWLTAREPEKVT